MGGSLKRIRLCKEPFSGESEWRFWKVRRKLMISALRKQDEWRTHDTQKAWGLTFPFKDSWRHSERGCCFFVGPFPSELCFFYNPPKLDTKHPNLWNHGTPVTFFPLFSSNFQGVLKKHELYWDSTPKHETWLSFIDLADTQRECQAHKHHITIVVVVVIVKRYTPVI